MHHVQPSTFALHVTYTCPLSCKHCCFESSPKNKDSLSVDLMMETIDSLDDEHYKMVAFTGGEPTLLGGDLERLVALAHSRGFRTRVVSSVHFAKSKSYAALRLGALRAAGLDELSISWDDFHEEFVAFENVRNAVTVCLDLEISVAIAITEDRDSKWTSERVRKELGASASRLTAICDSPLNMTGRAGKELAHKQKLATSHLGACPYVLTGPTLSAKGKLLACCGVIPETQALIVDECFRPTTLQDSVERAQSSVLYNWLYMLGPYDLLSAVCDEHDLVAPPAEAIHGNCEACQLVLSDPRYSRNLSSTLRKNAHKIGDLKQVLGELGGLQAGRPLLFLPG